VWAWACESHLVEVCARVWGDAFEDLHVLNEELTSNFDLFQSCTILPARTECRVGQAVSPSRVKTRCVGVHAGNLSAGDEAAGEESQDPNSRAPEVVGREDLLVPEPGYFEQFRGQISRFISLDDIFG
jgi:hypothetical protein